MSCFLHSMLCIKKKTNNRHLFYCLTHFCLLYLLWRKQSHMIARLIGYLLTVLCSIYLFFMYNGVIWTGLLILEILYPLCSFLFLWHMGRNITVRFGRFPAMAEREKPFTGVLVFHNHSRIWSVRYRVRARVRNHFSKQSVPGRRKNGSGSPKGLPIEYASSELAPSGEQKLEIKLDSQYAGTIEYCLRSLVLYDMLGIFCRSIPLNERRTIGIMPPFELILLWRLHGGHGNFPRRRRNIPLKRKGMTPVRSTRSGNTGPLTPSIQSTGSSAPRKII